MIAAGLAPATAAAEDLPDPGELAQQISSSTASASATNDNSTSQSAVLTQSGGGAPEGQSQTVVQSAPTEQSATAAASSNQSASNVSHGETAEQHVASSAAATASNSNHVAQAASQDQAGAPSPDAAPGARSPSEGQSQTSSQSAPTRQNANASATATQVAPQNINVIVRVDSPGDDGAVTQTNTSEATAVGSNSSGIAQDATQAQSGRGPSSGQTQETSQIAPTDQDVNATASSTQVAPTNLNIVIRNKSPGDEAAVTQTNTARSTADASNTSDGAQGAAQTQTAATPSTAQSQQSMQSAPVNQDATSTATSTQSVPANWSGSVSIDDSALDPNGSGQLGTLIQIWIPLAGQTRAGGDAETPQANSSSADASSQNSNQTTQNVNQEQSAESAGGSHLGGGSQTQIVQQTAPSTQTATASAISDQSGGPATQTNTSSASAIAANSNQIDQTVQQIQDNWGTAGTQIQIVEQTVPTVHTAVADATADDGWVIAVETNSGQAVQSATQTQHGGGIQTQVLVQETSTRQNPVGLDPCKWRIRCNRSGAAPKRASDLRPQLSRSIAPWLPSSEPQGSAPASKSTRTDSHGSNSPDSRAPRPRDPLGPSAGSGGSPNGGGFAWGFAALLIPFALTVSWWARRYRPSAFRRLMGVVLRQERPG
jgi:hypothetical protein